MRAEGPKIRRSDIKVGGLVLGADGKGIWKKKPSRNEDRTTNRMSLTKGGEEEKEKEGGKKEGDRLDGYQKGGGKENTRGASFTVGRCLTSKRKE